MSDKRFIEQMIPTPSYKRGGPHDHLLKEHIRHVVECSKYERPKREMIDEPEPKRRSYDSI